MVRQNSGRAGMLRWLMVGLAAVLAMGAGALPPRVADVPEQAGDTVQAATIRAMALNTLKEDRAQAVIVKVVVDGREIVTAAYGESMTGVPATTDMHFRNGAVAIS